jgi:hypothetical protein
MAAMVTDETRLARPAPRGRKRNFIMDEKLEYQILTPISVQSEIRTEGAIMLNPEDPATIKFLRLGCIAIKRDKPKADAVPTTKASAKTKTKAKGKGRWPGKH